MNPSFTAEFSTAFRRFPVFNLMGLVPAYLAAYFVYRGVDINPPLMAGAGVYFVFLSSVIGQVYSHRGYARPDKAAKDSSYSWLIRHLAGSVGPICLACAGTEAVLLARTNQPWLVTLTLSASFFAACLAFGAWGLVGDRKRAVDQIGLALPLALLVLLPKADRILKAPVMHPFICALILLALSALIWLWCARRVTSLGARTR